MSSSLKDVRVVFSLTMELLNEFHIRGPLEEIQKSDFFFLKNQTLKFIDSSDLRLYLEFEENEKYSVNIKGRLFVLNLYLKTRC